MNRFIDAINITDFSSESFNLQTPTHCPCCHTALEPKHLSSYYLITGKFLNSNLGKLYALYFCPKCEECFLAHYAINSSDNGQFYGKLNHLTPYSETKTIFSDKINSLSSNFINIYHQAEKAENIGLTEICGLGYRKALEFLVKDYALFLYPEAADAIKSKMLSSCINDYIENKKIKSLAKASAWIGNDETHYVRKHKDYNLEHLKTFISAIVSYIDSELLYLEAESLLNKPNE